MQARPPSHDCSHHRQSNCSKANKSHCDPEIKISSWKPKVGVLRFTPMLNKYSNMILTPLVTAEKLHQTLFLFFSSVAVMEQSAQKLALAVTSGLRPFVSVCACAILVWLFLFALHILLDFQAKNLSSSTPSSFLFFNLERIFCLACKVLSSFFAQSAS